MSEIARHNRLVLALEDERDPSARESLRGEIEALWPSVRAEAVEVNAQYALASKMAPLVAERDEDYELASDHLKVEMTVGPDDDPLVVAQRALDWVARERAERSDGSRLA